MKPEETRPDTIETILANEDSLIPSSGFLARVMESVEKEAVEPPPIPFPWKRFLPGFALALLVLGWGAVEIVRYALSSAGNFTLPEVHWSAASTMSRPMENAAWIAGSLAVAVVAWLFSRRLAGRSGLL
ncbi:MAG TPA: hypothetical protein VGJ21_04550 [Terracidiphilus sp.]